jgi:hypothetical protein
MVSERLEIDEKQLLYKQEPKESCNDMYQEKLDLKFKKNVRGRARESVVNSDGYAPNEVKAHVACPKGAKTNPLTQAHRTPVGSL